MAARGEGRGRGRVSRQEVELARVHGSIEVRRLYAKGFVGLLWIVASSVPIWALRAVIEPLAGKTTNVHANIVISASLTLSLGVNGLQYLKIRSQRAEIERMRERATGLEQKALE